VSDGVFFVPFGGGVTAMHRPTWQLDRDIARVAIDGFRGELHLQAPNEGIGSLRFDGQSQPGHIQRVGFAEDTGRSRGLLQDAFVRGPDLIATYAQTADLRFVQRVYWRAFHSSTQGLPAVAAVDVLVSVETSRPESQPCVSVTNCLPAQRLCFLDGVELEPTAIDRHRPTDPAKHGHPGCILIRLPGDVRCCAAMVHPDDFCAATVTRDDDNHLRIGYRLFFGALEKGVLLRARVRTVFMPRQDDMAIASAWYHALATAKPPLTV
jgi:hypothetical protein